MTREELNEEVNKELEKEENTRKTKKIIKSIIKIILIFIILGTIFFSYTTYISTVKVSVREYRINNNKIPDSLNGIKIMQLSDLHYGSTMFYDNLKEIVKMSNERKPDVVVFTGDLIDKKYKISQEEKEKLTKQFKNISSTLGKYAIIGDEIATLKDIIIDNDDEITTIFNQSEFTILRNEYDLVFKDTNNPILLIGLSSLINNKQNIESGYSYFKQEIYNSNIFTIVLVHEPDSAEDITNSYNNTDLILAGHSHNGNIRIPFINKSVIKTNGSKKYNQDYYKINNTKLYISSGLGTPSGIRLFCRPTISLYRLSNK